MRQWADADDARTPSTEVVNRLRMAYRVAALLREKDSAAVVQTWFQGMNPRLDDVAPARLLREGDLEQAGPEVLAAARAFAATGRRPARSPPLDHDRLRDLRSPAAPSRPR